MFLCCTSLTPLSSSCRCVSCYLIGIFSVLCSWRIRDKEIHLFLLRPAWRHMQPAPSSPHLTTCACEDCMPHIILESSRVHD